MLRIDLLSSPDVPLNLLTPLVLLRGAGPDVGELHVLPSGALFWSSLCLCIIVASLNAAHASVNV